MRHFSDLFTTRKCVCKTQWLKPLKKAHPCMPKSEKVDFQPNMYIRAVERYYGFEGKNALFQIFSIQKPKRSNLTLA